MLQDKEKAATVFSAINVYVVEADATLVCFVCDACSEALRKRGFAGANITRYQDSLSHLLWRLQREAEELC
jgi:hypothetical protein